MNDEEAECAAIIDSMRDVLCWVRNVERQPHSFWLQTATDKFYPDFVAKLRNGKHLVVEYKGAHLMGPDTDEKRALGELWEARSNGECSFRLVGKDNMRQVLQETVARAAAFTLQ
jgi:type III restriction enzyme